MPSPVLFVTIKNAANPAITYTKRARCCARLTGSHDKSPGPVGMRIMRDKSFVSLWNETGLVTRPHEARMSVKISGPFDMFIWQYTKLANIWSDKCWVKCRDRLTCYYNWINIFSNVFRRLFIVSAILNCWIAFVRLLCQIFIILIYRILMQQQARSKTKHVMFNALKNLPLLEDL